MLKNRELSDLIESIVSISDFSRGKASQIIQKVSEQNQEYIIVKNNEPQAVLISIPDYIQLMNDKKELEKLREKITDLELLMIAEERLQKSDSANLSEEEVYKKLNISRERVAYLKDVVEIE